MVNSKTHWATKVSLFMANYERNLRIEANIRRKKRWRRWQSLQKNEKKDAEAKEKGNRVMLSIKDLVFKKWLVKKLVDYYVELYTIEEIIFINVVKLKLPTTMKIYLVVNMSQVVKYRKSVKEQKIKKPKLINITNFI